MAVTINCILWQQKKNNLRKNRPTKRVARVVATGHSNYTRNRAELEIPGAATKAPMASNKE